MKENAKQFCRLRILTAAQASVELFIHSVNKEIERIVWDVHSHTNTVPK